MSMEDSRFIKVSVIIPVYNSEKYIDKAIQSLLAQTLKDIEIILVNDGSKDGSKEIIDKYSNKYENIKAIHQNNQGVSMARNAGISVAQGEYIGFLDADDWVESVMYEKLYNASKQHSCDIVACNYSYVIDENRKEKVYFPITSGVSMTKEMIQNEVLKYLVGCDSFASPWNKIYKKTLIEDNIRFPKGIKIGEDYIFNLLAFYRADSFFYLNEELYNYRYVDDSAINSYKSEKFNNYMDFYFFKESIISNWEFCSFNEYKEVSSQWFIDKILFCIYNEISKNGINGIINGYKIMKTALVRDKINDISANPYKDNNFMNYLFKKVKERRYLEILMAVFYSHVICPKLMRIREG